MVLSSRTHHDLNDEIYLSYLCDQILVACDRIHKKLDKYDEFLPSYTTPVISHHEQPSRHVATDVVQPRPPPDPPNRQPWNYVQHDRDQQVPTYGRVSAYDCELYHLQFNPSAAPQPPYSYTDSYALLRRSYQSESPYDLPATFVGCHTTALQQHQSPNSCWYPPPQHSAFDHSLAQDPPPPRPLPCWEPYQIVSSKIIGEKMEELDQRSEITGDFEQDSNFSSPFYFKVLDPSSDADQESSSEMDSIISSEGVCGEKEVEEEDLRAGGKMVDNDFCYEIKLVPNSHSSSLDQETDVHQKMEKNDSLNRMGSALDAIDEPKSSLSDDNHESKALTRELDHAHSLIKVLVREKQATRREMDELVEQIAEEKVSGKTTEQMRGDKCIVRELMRHHERGLEQILESLLVIAFDPGGDISIRLMFASPFVVSWFPP